MATSWLFYHAADLHLDTPFSGIEQVSPDIAEELREASLEAFDSLIAQVITDRAEFLLLAGDIYDGAQRGMRAQFRVRDGLQRLSEEGISTFIIHGNHDPLDGWSAIKRWPERVHIFSWREVERVQVTRDGETLAAVYGISYATARVEENLSRRYARLPGPGVHVAMLHCNVGGASDHAAYSPCTMDDLRAIGMDYWALGHIHKRAELERGAPWVVYPGNLQGRSPKASECEPKGAYRVRVSDGTIERLEFIPLDRVRFVHLSVDATDAEDLQDLRARLSEEGSKTLSQHDGRTVLLRTTIAGCPSFHADLMRPEVIPSLVRELRDEFALVRPRLWWERVRTETRPPIDRAQLASGADFTAELLRESDRLVADGSGLAALVAQLASPLRRDIGASLSFDSAKLLGAAEMRALELLRETEGA